MEEDIGDEGYGGDGEIDPLRHPERALSEKDITYGAAATGCCHADDESAEEVEVLLARKSDAADGKGKGTDEIYYGDETEFHDK